MKRNFKRVRPVAGKVIVTPIEVERELTTTSGLVMPKSLDQIEREERDNDICEVIAVGKHPDGGQMEFGVGDRVIVARELMKKSHRGVNAEGEEIPIWIGSYLHVSGIAEDEAYDPAPETPNP